MRGRLHAASTVPFSALVLGSLLAACTGNQHTAAEAGARAIAPDAAGPTVETHPRTPKGVPSGHTPLKNYLVNNPRPGRLDGGGDASAPAAPPTSDPALPPPPQATAPGTTREPNWDLDVGDPARDYVTRYLRATKRYGSQMACVVITPSRFVADRSIVEIHNDASGTCGKADELRDRFFVQVTADRMKLDETLHQEKLKPWPDGSLPDGPPAKVADVPHLHAWKAPLRDALAKLQLAPIRIQLYGRGTYPVILLAGWHTAVRQGMSPSQLEGPARELCAANDGDSMGIFAGLDRSTFLRISCPGTARWEAL